MDILIMIFIIWFLLFIICICLKEAREGFYTFKEDLYYLIILSYDFCKK